jgi:hypothetical protein
MCQTGPDSANRKARLWRGCPTRAVRTDSVVTSLSVNHQSKLMDHDATATAISSPRRSRSRSGSRTLLDANSALWSGLPNRLKATRAAQPQRPCAALPRNVIAAAGLPELGVENVLPTKPKAMPKAMPKLRPETLELEDSILVRQTFQADLPELELVSGQARSHKSSRAIRINRDHLADSETPEV